MRISDWSSDVCSSDLAASLLADRLLFERGAHPVPAQSRGAIGPADSVLDAGSGRPYVPPRRRRAGQEFLGDAQRSAARADEIGRASCRERECHYVELSVVAGTFKTQKTKTTHM